ncbi:aquaglyceroporin, putative [Plasmodium knowlesi strain H]|uniref:Aquaglyceroporin, putative n=3 Tax=Plasmodium knowlesi TaxID=5850 RepID=A0A5K1VCZ3_PLAKH|nr:aquaglyceroporin, putative [Plasmodium knowlesi strain H]OTN65049.1 putative Aquaglyceroporin [Plasmodium knowlesi]CAA9988354.1 aquaglyceroporin, putative [Plasmodium knowlesi strain H]SBO20065.1 aquaglyceroporin, putative [Plasmodium knowlesi strain H]SBO20311.1 aquaglyceroporin, putative [Plasmodium knowlesi strain H]VVS77828.1 aquaglyceroporin, putative [Plasmodium knowlesi strain H]|eukprot:XP_002259334.1 aquaglyceroporin, putative [Plasmodium knowlesi strain H]
MQVQSFNPMVREFLGEFLGTFVLMFLGEGATANYHTVKNKDDWLRLCIGWSLGVFFGILTAAKLSGAHLNFAVTVGFATIKKFDYKKIPLYFVAQLLGAFSATASVYALYYGFVNNKSIPEFAWETGKNEFIGYTSAFMHELVLTGILLLVILLVIDENVCGHFNVLKLSAVVGLTILCIGLSFGGNTGFALNPSRDLGARLLSLVAYGSEAFTKDKCYFFVPLLAPIVGSVIVCQLYDKLIGPLIEAASTDKGGVEV